VSTDIKTNDMQGDYSIRSLKAGDVLKGRVADIKDGKIVIKISSQQTIEATIDPSIVVDKDSVIELLITSMKDTTIYAKILKPMEHKQLQNENTMETGLQNLGLSISQQNLDILRELIRYKQPVTKDVVDYINYLLKTCELFDVNYMESILKLAFCEKGPLNTPLHQLAKLVSLSEMKHVIRENGIEDEIIGDKNHNVVVDFFTRKLISENKVDEGMAESLKQLLNQSLTTVNVIKKADLEAIIFLLSKKIEVTPKNLLIHSQINEKSSIFSRYVEKIIESIKDYTDPRIQSIISRLNEFYIEPEDLYVAKNIDKNNELLKTMMQLESIIDESNDMNWELKQTMIDVRDLISFINSINDNINYLCIPMMINEKKTDVEIFVFERGKGSKKINPSNATIVICLYMPNLGYIESIIEVRDKNVNICFKSEDKTTADTIRTYSLKLIESLDAKGYLVSVNSFVKKDKVINPSSIHEIENPNMINSYNSIDVRI